MKVYGPNALRNVAVTGHGGSGKTSLVDALAYVSGSSRRHGRIKDGSTLTDTSPDEIERQHSITLGPAYAEWLDTKINLLDTPGYLEYLGEAVAALQRGRRRARRAELAPPASRSAPRRSGSSAITTTCRACWWWPRWTRTTPTSRGCTRTCART